MENDELISFIIEIKTSLSRLEAKLDNVQTTLANHETRIQRVEESGSGSTSMKDRIIEYLLKCLIAALAIGASLSGAGSIITSLVSK